MTNRTILLQNGVGMPQLGLGTWQVPDAAAERSVEHALRFGYRHIDTAVAYENESGVGRGLKRSGVGRGEVFLTSKILAECKNYGETKRMIDCSLRALGTDYLDLMLIHAPRPWDEMGDDNGYRYEEENAAVWRALEEGYTAGKFRAIGVSNFEIDDLRSLMRRCSIPPMVDQVRAYAGEIPWELLEFCRTNRIAAEAYSPLATGGLLKRGELASIAEKYGVGVPQLCIAYVMQLGMIAIPKAVSPAHIEENTELGFTISEDDMRALAAL